MHHLFFLYDGERRMALSNYSDVRCEVLTNVQRYKQVEGNQRVKELSPTTERESEESAWKIKAANLMAGICVTKTRVNIAPAIKICISCLFSLTEQSTVINRGLVEARFVGFLRGFKIIYSFLNIFFRLGFVVFGKYFLPWLRTNWRATLE